MPLGDAMAKKTWQDGPGLLEEAGRARQDRLLLEVRPGAPAVVTCMGGATMEAAKRGDAAAAKVDGDDDGNGGWAMRMAAVDCENVAADGGYC